MRIMVVDDEKDIKLLFEQQFRKEIKSGRLIFLFAFTGEEVLEYLQTNSTTKPILVLADINMPGMNGLDLLKNIKQKYPKLKVAMITAYGDERNYRQAIECGCDDYISKPINFAELKEKVFTGYQEG